MMIAMKVRFEALIMIRYWASYDQLVLLPRGFFPLWVMDLGHPIGNGHEEYWTIMTGYEQINKV